MGSGRIAGDGRPCGFPPLIPLESSMALRRVGGVRMWIETALTEGWGGGMISAFARSRRGLSRRALPQPKTAPAVYAA